ncbi:MAG: ATP-binding protein [Bradymonadaceae bacterium]
MVSESIEIEQHSGVDGAPGGRLVLDEDGTILEIPHFLLEALDIEERHVPSIYHLFDPLNPPYLSLSRVYRHTYGATEYHLRLEGRFGTPRSFRYWPVPSADDDEGAAFFIVDESANVQDREWAVRRLRREILNDVQTSLLSNFKNRLTSVQVLAEMIGQAPSLAQETVGRLVDASRDLSTALNRVTSGIDDLSSPRDYQDLPIRLADLHSVITTWSSSEVVVHCHLEEVDSGTLIPASSVERILMPIVQNALEASNNEGIIQVEIREIKEGFAHVLVEDFGEGMTDRIRRRAEDPFFTTRGGHLGLGLAHAREALREAGGQWKIESKPHHGTRFTILLPVTTASHLFR